MIRALFFCWIFLASNSGIVQGQENPPLQLVFFDAPPFSWKKDGQVQGLAIELLNEILTKRMKLDVGYEIIPWKRGQKLVKEGIRDGFLTQPTEIRKAYTEVSEEPLFIFNFILFANTSNPRWHELQKVRTLEDLKPFQICSVLGTAWDEKLKGMRTQVVNKPRQAFLMMNNKRCDTFVAPQLIGMWAVKKLGLEQIVTGIPEAVMERIPYHLMIAQQSRFRDILPQFDQVVIKLKNEGILKEINQKYITGTFEPSK